MENLSLDEHGIMAGTDKCSLDHDYLRHYEIEFAPFREQAINVIEIGVFGGASLGLWERHFPNAKIVGIDINPECTDYETPRTAIEIGSQADLAFLTRIATQYPFTIFIDDGSHRADHVKITFEHMFPRLQPGGVYVVEDLHFHLGKAAAKWRGEGTITPPEYVQTLTTALAGQGVGPEVDAPLKGIVDSIDRIVQIRRAAFVWKKRENSPLARLEQMQAVVEKSRRHLNWRKLAELIVNNGGSLDQAEFAIRQGIALTPKSWRLHKTLAMILQRKGDIDGAQAVVRDARHLAPEKLQATIDRREAIMQRRGTLKRDADDKRGSERTKLAADREARRAKRAAKNASAKT